MQYNRWTVTGGLQWARTQAHTVDEHEHERGTMHADTIADTGIDADVAESSWAYERARRWRFGVVAHAAHTWTSHCAVSFSLPHATRASGRHSHHACLIILFPDGTFASVPLSYALAKYKFGFKQYASSERPPFHYRPRAFRTPPAF